MWDCSPGIIDVEHADHGLVLDYSGPPQWGPSLQYHSPGQTTLTCVKPDTVQEATCLFKNKAIYGNSKELT